MSGIPEQGRPRGAWEWGWGGLGALSGKEGRGVQCGCSDVKKINRSVF